MASVFVTAACCPLCRGWSAGTGTHTAPRRGGRHAPLVTTAPRPRGASRWLDRTSEIACLTGAGGGSVRLEGP